MIDQDLSVFPMVPAGAPIEDVFDAEDLAKKDKKRIDRFLTKRYHSFNVVKQYRITARIAQM